MKKLPEKIKERIISIVKEDYEECRFYTAASQLLVNKINDISKSLEQESVDFTEFRDSIGEIGIFLSNAEKRLLEVEECYTKLVEALADDENNGPDDE